MLGVADEQQDLLRQITILIYDGEVFTSFARICQTGFSVLMMNDDIFSTALLMNSKKLTFSWFNIFV